MRSVGDVARLTSLTVRTLHRYDQMNLLPPSERTPAGYRLCSTADLERLQLVLHYRAAGLPLEQIRRLLNAASVDRGAWLHGHRRLLAAHMQRLHALIGAVDAAIAAHEQGVTMSDAAMFAVFGEEQQVLHAEAEERWGDTDAWAATRNRTAHFSADDWVDVKRESAEIMQRLADVYQSGARSGSVAAMDAVEARRMQIERRFYPCSRAMQVSLAKMFVADPRFVATYDALAVGLLAWTHDAIVANAARAG